MFKDVMKTGLDCLGFGPLASNALRAADSIMASVRSMAKRSSDFW